MWDEHWSLHIKKDIVKHIDFFLLKLSMFETLISSVRRALLHRSVAIKNNFPIV